MLKQIVKNNPTNINGKTYYINGEQVSKFGVVDIINDEDDYYQYNNVSFQIKTDNKSTFSFCFEITEFPGNCSIFVLYELKLTTKETENLTLKELITILDSLIKRGFTFSITTNGTKSYKIIEAALNKSKYWTKVKSYKSASSGNIISIYMTNND